MECDCGTGPERYGEPGVYLGEKNFRFSISDFGLKEFVMIFRGWIDGNGNVTAMVKSTDGTAAAKYEYSPYGEVLTATGSYAAGNPFRFSTKYTDAETGLAYFGYRYYNPETGRWLNRDPIGEEGGLNLYEYVKNDPLTNIDPSGRYSFQCSLGDPSTAAKTACKCLKNLPLLKNGARALELHYCNSCVPLCEQWCLSLNKGTAFEDKCIKRCTMMGQAMCAINATVPRCSFKFFVYLPGGEN